MEIGIVGSGNLAGHLARHLSTTAHVPTFIHSRNTRSAKALSRTTEIPYVKEVPKASSKNAFLLLCVSDDAIEACSRMYQELGYTLIHFSGRTPLQKFTNSSRSTGVIWPVQTLASSVRPDWKTIPLCIEANSTKALAQVRKLAKLIGGPVYLLNSEARATAHLAAVFVNNFVNAQYIIAESLLKSKHIPFEMLLPLIQQTVSGTKKSGNRNSQTGPARRGDLGTLKAQEHMLKDKPELAKVYKAISDFLLREFGHRS
jgi:predicted short-subunit dehydrogenase-like oxidoreductase (DUF2520 family)